MKVRKSLLSHWRLVFFVVLLIAAAVIYDRTGLKQEFQVSGLASLKAMILGHGWSGAAVFIGIYILFVTLGLPNLPFQLAAGAIYGVWKAFPLMYAGVNLGALTAFFLARALGRRGIEELAGRHIQTLNSHIGKGGFRYLLTLRLIPLMPFNAINYGAGLSRLPLRTYILANVVGMLPLTFLHVLFGSAAGTLDLHDPHSWTNPQIVFALLGGVASVILAILVYRRSKRNKI